MSEVPRYLVSRHHMHAWRENVMVTDHIGMVTYADHVAALAEAEHEWACGKSRSVQDCGCRLAGYAEARAKWADIGRDAGYDEGYAAALGKSREAVAPFVTQDCGVDDCTRHYSPALGAIDRLIRAAGQAPAAPLGEVT